MHDIADLETAGVPGVMVASAEFVEAAAAQAAALGADPARVFVPHPIQDRTDEEMRALADGCVEEILGWLVQPPAAAPTPGKSGSVPADRP